MGHCLAVQGPGGVSPCAKVLAPAVSQDEFQKVDWPAIMERLKNSPALPFFKQGMTQYYGLNYEEAIRNFKKAKEVDKTTAMAPWGIALAAGPNINLGMDRACHELACSEIECADSLAGGVKKKGCEPGGSTTALEKELISALKKRYPCPVKEGLTPKEAKDAADAAAEKYSKAMGDVWEKNKQDKNISTLYAESMMDLHPWDLYDRDGLPKREQTRTIVDVLKKSTGDFREAIGANHFYIHAVEGSNPYVGTIHPDDALPSANLLQTQVEKSGHLVHMSSHIYLLLGDYKKSLDVNIKGANNDVRQYSVACRGTYDMYTKDSKCPQLYYGHYLSHNYFFGSVSATFMGRSKDAITLACQTQDHVQRFMAYEPGLQRYMTATLMTMVVNRSWKAVCDETNCDGPNPSDPNSEPKFENCYSQGSSESRCYILRAIWYWARGMARRM
jgi:tetratricopeptide (TPR) repeat protein